MIGGKGTDGEKVIHMHIGVSCEGKSEEDMR